MDRSSSNIDAAGIIVDRALSHYGVTGMRWGVRRKIKESPSKDAERVIVVKKRARRSGTKALTNAELQEAINRMNLEQNYKRLRTNEANVVKRFVASTLLDVGKQQVTNIAREEIGSAIARRRGK